MVNQQASKPGITSSQQESCFQRWCILQYKYSIYTPVSSYPFSMVGPSLPSSCLQKSGCKPSVRKRGTNIFAGLRPFQLFNRFQRSKRSEEHQRTIFFVTRNSFRKLQKTRKFQYVSIDWWQRHFKTKMVGVFYITGLPGWSREHRPERWRLGLSEIRQVMSSVWGCVIYSIGILNLSNYYHLIIIITCIIKKTLLSNERIYRTRWWRKFPKIRNSAAARNSTVRFNWFDIQSIWIFIGFKFKWFEFQLIPDSHALNFNCIQVELMWDSNRSIDLKFNWL